MTVKADGVKKPAFLVVRKKASLLVKKKLAEVKNFSSTPRDFNKPTSNIHNEKPNPSNMFKKLVPVGARKPGSDTNFMPLSEKRIVKKPAPLKKSEWAVSNQNNSSSYNTGVISSLFWKNPEIPVVAKDTVEATEENVFSTLSFSTLNIHKYLV